MVCQGRGLSWQCVYFQPVLYFMLYIMIYISEQQTLKTGFAVLSLVGITYQVNQFSLILNSKLMSITTTHAYAWACMPMWVGVRPGLTPSHIYTLALFFIGDQWWPMKKRARVSGSDTVTNTNTHVAKTDLYTDSPQNFPGLNFYTTSLCYQANLHCKRK